MARFLILLFLGLQAHAWDLDKLYEKAQFKVGMTKFSAYIADNEQKRAQGLMFINKLPPDTGMLFIFEQEQPLNFWMKNTLIPLSIGFFSAKGKLVDQQEMKPGSSLMSLDVPTYKSSANALFALEMESGWFAKHKVKKGAQLRLTSKTTSALLKSKLKH